LTDVLLRLAESDSQPVPGEGAGLIDAMEVEELIERAMESPGPSVSTGEGAR